MKSSIYFATNFICIANIMADANIVSKSYALDVSCIVHALANAIVSKPPCELLQNLFCCNAHAKACPHAPLHPLHSLRACIMPGCIGCTTNCTCGCISHSKPLPQCIHGLHHAWLLACSQACLYSRILYTCTVLAYSLHVLSILHSLYE